MSPLIKLTSLSLIGGRNKIKVIQMLSISKKCAMIGVAVIAAAALVIGLAFSKKNKIASNALSSSATEGLSYPFMATETNEGPMHVKLAPGVDASYLEQFGSVTPLFTLPYDTLKELSGSKPGLDLTLWYRVMPNLSISSTQEVYYLLDQDYVTAIVIPVSSPPPRVDYPPPHRQLQGTPNFESNQDYLRPNSATNNGIDAEYSWTFEGGTGEGVTIYDIEHGWNLFHEDVTSSFIATLVPPGAIGIPFNDNDSHGTAVLGEMIGTSNGFGVKGISHGATAKVAPENTNLLGPNRANAIILATNDGKPGDVILLEMQTAACDSNKFGPAEWAQDVFDATEAAVRKGLIVVAAAGNGEENVGIDLDSPQCNGRFDRTNRDSGAIIVGAGGSGRPGCDPARQKMGFSSFGSRVDVHGWGECVWSMGYGTGHQSAANPPDRNTFYTATFSGTSSASPFVAAAAANIQGIAMKRFGFPLDPRVVRKLLTDTGLPQLGNLEVGRIGPLVNLRNAIDKLLDGEITSRPTRTPTRAKANKAGKTL